MSCDACQGPPSRNSFTTERVRFEFSQYCPTSNVRREKPGCHGGALASWVCTASSISCPQVPSIFQSRVMPNSDQDIEAKKTREKSAFHTTSTKLALCVRMLPLEGKGPNDSGSSMLPTAIAVKIALLPPLITIQVSDICSRIWSPPYTS